MSKRFLIGACGLAILFLLIVAVERQRNCSYAGGVHCPTFGIGTAKYGGPSHRP